jgi:hypothetical protein
MQLGWNPRLAIGVTALTVVLATAVPISVGQTGDVRSSGAQEPSGAPQPPGAQPATDTRERVHLTPAERDAMVVEMRTMLRSLRGIMHGLVANDLVMARDAARASGVAVARDPGLEKKLPLPFSQLARRTRQRFDALADALKAGAGRDAVLRRLAAITGSCVTCHDTYRLDERRD